MEKKYWIIVNGEQRGPYTLDELTSRPDLTPQTPVWHEGLSDWTTADRLPELTGPRCAARPPKSSFTATVSPTGGEPLTRPRTYMFWALAATLCCCLPTGIVAIIYAAKVSPAFNAGDYEGAKRASERAGWWCIISAVAGLIWAPFSMLYSLLTSF